jgi:hypothetical protein
MAGTGRRSGRDLLQTAPIAMAAAQAITSGEHSRRFLSIFGNTKRKVMVCGLSWFWDETTKRKLFVELFDKEYKEYGYLSLAFNRQIKFHDEYCFCKAVG